MFDKLPSVLTARDVAEVLHIGYQKALNIIKYSGIPYIKIGNCYRVSKDIFIKFINSDKTQEFIFE